MVLVTGGTGLLGAHVLFELSNQPVRALKRTTSDLTSLHEIFYHYDPDGAEERLARIEWVDGDLSDVFSLESAVSGIACVYHCAAMVSFDPKDADLLRKVNAEGTANLVNCCLDVGVQRFCHVSSTATIGKHEHVMLDEEAAWENGKHQSAYSISKMLAEREVWRGQEEGLQVVVVNPCIIVGPGNWEESSSTTFKRVWEGLKYYSTGSNAFVDVRDVAHIMVQLIEQQIFHERFLITGENWPFRRFFDEVAVALNRPKPHVLVKPWMTGLAWRLFKLRSWLTGKPPLVTKETAKSSRANYAYDNSKIRKTLDFSFTPLEESIRHAAEFFIAQQEGRTVHRPASKELVG